MSMLFFFGECKLVFWLYYSLFVVSLLVGYGVCLSPSVSAEDVPVRSLGLRQGMQQGLCRCPTWLATHIG